MRKQIQTYAELRTDGKCRDSGVQKQDAVRRDPMNLDTLVGTCHTCGNWTHSFGVLFWCGNWTGRKRSIEIRCWWQWFECYISRDTQRQRKNWRRERIWTFLEQKRRQGHSALRLPRFFCTYPGAYFHVLFLFVFLLLQSFFLALVWVL